MRFHNYTSAPLAVCLEDYPEEVFVADTFPPGTFDEEDVVWLQPKECVEVSYRPDGEEPHVHFEVSRQLICCGNNDEGCYDAECSCECTQCDEVRSMNA